MAARKTIDQIDCGLHVLRELRGRPQAVDVHVEDARLFAEEVIMQRRHVEPLLEQR